MYYKSDMFCVLHKDSQEDAALLTERPTYVCTTCLDIFCHDLQIWTLRHNRSFFNY